MIPEFILYSDFTSPSCYALEERLRKLRADDRLVWRGVQRGLHRNRPADAAVPAQAMELAQEVAPVRRCWPDLLIAEPKNRPDTGDAIKAMAAFLLIDDVRAQAFKLACYHGFWHKGWDLSDRRTLYTLAEGVGLARTAFELLDHPHIAETVALWQQQWEKTGIFGLPVLIRRDGAKLVGLADRDQIDRFLDGDDSDISPQSDIP